MPFDAGQNDYEDLVIRDYGMVPVDETLTERVYPGDGRINFKFANPRAAINILIDFDPAEM